MINSKTYKIDLHGEEVAVVNALVIDAINYNKKINNKVFIIIHGKSTNILTKEVHNILKNNKDVKSYKLDNFNLGQTIVELK